MYQVYTPKKDYKVLVRCMTYNQSKYIEDALNGFAMQQTDFPFVCLVMDDCSTDGEQGVIKAWMERECDMNRAEKVEIEKSFITLVPHKSNMNCQFAFYFLKENLYKKGGKIPMITPWREHCEYEALCEGDDYWIHPGKLQMQVDVLDSNKIGACYTKACMINQKKGKIVRKIGKSYCGVEELLQCQSIPNVTSMIRIQLGNQYRQEICPQNKGWLMGDFPLWIWLEINSKILFIDEVTSVYRELPESASHSQDIEKKLAFAKSKFKIKTFFIDKYNLPAILYVQACDTLARDTAHCYGASDRSEFIKYIKSCSKKTLKDYVKVVLASLKLYP